MRTALMTAILLSLTGAAFASAGDVTTRRPTNIPEQSLDTALQLLAKDRGLQMIYPYKVVGELRTPGATGQLTFEEALKRILQGTKLTYRYIDEKTVTIVPAVAGSGSALVEGAGLVRWARVEDAAMRAVEPSAAQASRQGGKEEEDEEEQDKEKEVVVTGSRLKQANPASPVITIDLEEIKAKGFSNPDDIIRSLPMNFSSVGRETINQGVNYVNYEGSAFADLRGMGAANTLILVNGRRLAASSVMEGTAVNLSTIPMEAIERVEVMSGGGAAVYGSDAVAGVINFILKEDAESSITAKARYEAAEHGSNTYVISQNFNKQWDRGSLRMTVGRNHRESDSLREAGATTLDFTDRGGTDHRSIYDGQPGVAYSVFSGFPDERLGTLPAGQTVLNDISELSLDNVVPFDSLVFTPSSLWETDSLVLNGRYGLTDKFDLFADMRYIKNKSRSIGGAPYVSGVMTTNNPSNRSGEDIYVRYYLVEEYNRGLIDAPQNRTSHANVGYTLGLNGDLPFKNWTTELSAGYDTEKSDTQYYSTNELRASAVLSGLDVNGNPVPMINPFSRDGTGHQPGALDGLMEVYTSASPRAETEMSNALWSANGGLFNLPGGEVRAAVGTEYRQEILNYKANVGSITLPLINNKQKRALTAGFSELNIPIVGRPNSFLGVRALSLNLAARWEEYAYKANFDEDSSGSHEKVTYSRVSPRAGLSWTAVQGLHLRVSWDESFRAPALPQLFAAAEDPNDPNAFLFSWFNPATCTNVLVSSTCTERGRAPWVFTGNPHLKPELGTTISYGFDWTPGGVLEGLKISATRYTFDFTDKIIYAGTIVPRYIAYMRSDVLYRAGGPGTPVTAIHNLPINISKQTSEDLDVSASFAFGTGAGDFDVGARVTRKGELKRFLFDGHTGVDLMIAGGRYGLGAPPAQRGDAWVRWNRGNLGLNVFFNYKGPYDFLDSDGDGEIKRIGHYSTTDLTARYSMPRYGLDFNGGILDVLSTPYPFVNQRYQPWDSSVVNGRGRVFYLEISKRFAY